MSARLPTPTAMADPQHRRWRDTVDDDWFAALETLEAFEAIEADVQRTGRRALRVAAITLAIALVVVLVIATAAATA
jgi:hypothetical protein